jgi:hypothetical protein
MTTTTEMLEQKPTSTLLEILSICCKPGSESYRQIVKELWRRDRDPYTGGYVLFAANQHRDELIKQAHEFRSSLKLEWDRITRSDLVVVRDPVINDVELANEVKVSLESHGFNLWVGTYEKAEGVAVHPDWGLAQHDPDGDIEDTEYKRFIKDEILPVVALLNRLGYEADYDRDIDGSCIHVERGPQRPKPKEVL